MKEYSIWLIPENKDEKYLNSIIGTLAEKYQVFSFIPHLTVFTVKAEEESEEEIKKVVDKIANITKCFNIKVDKVNHSELLHKTLYIKMKNNKNLQNLYQALKNNYTKFNNFELKPHMSLLYKNRLAIGEKQTTIKELKLKEEFMFDKLLIIKASKGIVVEKDILDWEVIYKKSLIT